MQARFLESLPESRLNTLSCCDPNVGAISDWISALPMANTEEAAGKLLDVCMELCSLSIQPKQRIELLETLRPPLHYVCTRFDTSPANLSHPNTKPSRIAQSLQAELATAYKMALRDFCQLPDAAEGSNRSLIGLSIHRIASDLSRTILRACQFYTEVSPQIWAELHQLYQMAVDAELATELFRDEENHAVIETSITDVYLRILLLVSARPNQLRHRHLTALFHGLEVWTPYVSLETPDEDTLLLVDPQSNKPPRYKALAQSNSKASLDLKTDVLVFELEAFLNELDTKIEVPDYLHPDLLGHIIRAWGVMKKRVFKRSPAEGKIKICVGLRVIHYYITGGVDFADQLGSTEALLRREINPFSGNLSEYDSTRPAGASASKDVWQNGSLIPQNPNIIDPNKVLLKGIKSSKTRSSASYPCFDTHITDSSPNGYQLRWPEGVPQNLQTGELLAIRDDRDDRWCIAVARWIRQADKAAFMGVELLSPRAVPMAVRLVKKKGGPTDYSRALLLPALEVIGQPAMLITPPIPFDENQKIHIQRQGIKTTAQLMRRIRVTESFSQFTFRMLDGYLENALINMNIDSIGDN